MPDFYADFPFPEVVLKISDAEKFCAVGDMIIGTKPGRDTWANARVEKFVDGGILVHPIKDQDFESGDTLVSPTGISTISEVVKHA